MRSHRLALIGILLAAATATGGCGSGRQKATYDSDAGSPGTAVQAAGAGEAAPVVIAGPKQEVLAERDAAAAAAAKSRKDAAEAEARRKAARRELAKEHARAERSEKRAAAREILLRRALAAKRRAEQAEDSTPTPKAGQTTPIGASDVTGSDLAADRDRRSDAEARAAVVRFHELLDRHDPRACDLMTARLLAEVHGAAPGALERCRSGVAAGTASVSVVIAESRAHGKRATVAVVSRLGDTQAAQTLHLVLVDGTWLIDRVERKPAS